MSTPVYLLPNSRACFLSLLWPEIRSLALLTQVLIASSQFTYVFHSVPLADSKLAPNPAVLRHQTANLLGFLVKSVLCLSPATTAGPPLVTRIFYLRLSLSLTPSSLQPRRCSATRLLIFWGFWSDSNTEDETKQLKASVHFLMELGDTVSPIGVNSGDMAMRVTGQELNPSIWEHGLWGRMLCVGGESETMFYVPATVVKQLYVAKSVHKTMYGGYAC